MPPLKPGQKYPTPTPGFGDRVFYESLLKRRPDSEMAQDWCVGVTKLFLPLFFLHADSGVDGACGAETQPTHFSVGNLANSLFESIG